jgi:serine/threonine protein kinase
MAYLDEDSLLNIEHEREILSRLDHANIPKLIEVASSSDHIYLIKQMVSGITFE